MTLSAVERHDLPQIRALIASAIRANVAQSEGEAPLLLSGIDESLA